MSVNTDLSPSFLLPGIFGQLDLRQGAVMLGGYSKSVIVVGYKSSAGLAQLNSPTVLSNDADIAAQVGTDSDLAEDVRACFSVPGVRGVVQVAVLPVAEPTGGVQATFPFEFVPPPVSGAPGTALSATAAHQLELMVGAQKHYLSVLQGDTFAQIAAAAVTTLNQNARLLYTASQFGRTVVLGAGNSRYSFTGLAAGYSVVLLDPGQANQSLSASIANNLLTINLATDNAAALTTTGTQLSTYLTANLAAGLANKIAYAVTTGSDGSGVLAAAATFKLPYASVLLTAKHKGKTGNALPIRVRFSSDGGVRTSCGYAYFDGTSPNAASSYQLALGPESVNTVLGVSQTSTQSAAAVRDQVNAGGYAVTAASSANLLMLYHVFGLDQTEGRDVRRVGLTGTGISPQTVAGAFGVTGSGVPDLTTALAVMQGQPAYLVWHTRLVDATSLAALKTHIGLFGNGKYQKPQILSFSSADAATALASTLSSAGLASFAYSVAWNLPNAAVPDGVLGARIAGMIAKLDYVAMNLAKALIPTSGSLLLPTPAPAAQQQPDDQNISLLSLGISPITIDASGNHRILFAQNTIPIATAEDERTCLLQTVLAMFKVRDMLNRDLNEYLFSDEGGKNIRPDNVTHTPFVVTPESLEKRVGQRLLVADAQDLIMVADLDLEELKVVQEPGRPSIYNLALPVRPVGPLRQLVYRQSLG